MVTSPIAITRAQVATLAAELLRDPSDLAGSADEPSGQLTLSEIEPGLIALDSVTDDGVSESVLIDESGYLIDPDVEADTPRRPY